jgi:hypothetical protein
MRKASSNTTQAFDKNKKSRIATLPRQAGTKLADRLERFNPGDRSCWIRRLLVAVCADWR